MFNCSMFFKKNLVVSPLTDKKFLLSSSILILICCICLFIDPQCGPEKFYNISPTIKSLNMPNKKKQKA